MEYENGVMEKTVADLETSVKGLNEKVGSITLAVESIGAKVPAKQKKSVSGFFSVLLLLLILVVVTVNALCDIGYMHIDERGVGFAWESQSAFIVSKEAYENISKAYELVADFGDDIYEAWRMGIYEDDLTLKTLADELNVSYEDLKCGFAYEWRLSEWDSLTDEEKKQEIENAESNFELMMLISDSKFSTCVNAVSGAYTATEKGKEITQYIEAARASMKELSMEYTDYAHYPNLKKFYTNTVSYFGFCNSPTGSFEQIVSTKNDYTAKAREYIADLDFIFGE